MKKPREKKPYVVIKDKYSDHVRTIRLRDYVEEKLESSPYCEGGVLEEVRNTADRVKDAVSRLCEVLYKSQHLTEKEVFYIAGEYLDEDYSEWNPVIVEK